MSAKTSATRRAAFFKALEETGNATLAAERAKVSRSWVTLHCIEDPAFKAAYDAARAKAKARLSEAIQGKPPSGWGHLDGEELVVRGTNGRRCQIARARLRQWTPRVENRFLAALAATCSVKAACAEVGLTQASAYNHRNRWTAFAKRWDEAIELGTMRLELALVEYASSPFSATELPELAAMPPISPDQAMHNLYMHQHRTAGIGGRPGRYAQPSFEESARVILRKIEAIERGRGVPEADMEAARRDWALRRSSEQAQRRG